MGILREDTDIAKRLSRPPITIELIRKRIEEQRPPPGRVPTSGDMPLSESCKEVLRYAAEEADRLGDKHIGTNHLLIGLVRKQDGLAAKVLAEVGINPSEIRDEIALMGDSTRKIASPQKRKLEDYIVIHGELWNSGSVRELSA